MNTNKIPPKPKLMSVSGPLTDMPTGIVDAHNHLWIEPDDPETSSSPVLNSYGSILEELTSFQKLDGCAIIDCQPAYCGRNAKKLRNLSKQTGITICSASGFHLQKYYPENSPLWQMNEHQLTDFFVQELTCSVIETKYDDDPIRAGFLKIALEPVYQDTPIVGLNAVINASKECNASVLIHTEKGENAEKIVNLLINQNIPPEKIILCHVDKRPDISLHIELAKAGVLLEYDTFFRPKYLPDINVWPLLNKMIKHGYEDFIALATDMAETSHWISYGGNPGLAGWKTIIFPKLINYCLNKDQIQKITNRNILNRLLI